MSYKIICTIIHPPKEEGGKHWLNVAIETTAGRYKAYTASTDSYPREEELQQVVEEGSKLSPTMAKRFFGELIEEELEL
jgi:hypothetical protein